jgi:diguanylate cyclase (GGDEF)-like protein
LAVTQKRLTFSGDLKRLTTLIGVAIAFFGMLLLGIIAYAGWSSNQSAVERERTLLDNALNEGIARVLNEQKSVAWWDDPIIKITDEVIDLEFTDANFGVFLTETYGQDEVYILNAEDKPLYAWAEAAREVPSAFERRRPALEALIDEIRRGGHSKLKTRPDMFDQSKDRYQVLTGVQIARYAGHIVSVDGRPAIIAGMTIVPNIDMSILKGTPNLLLSITFVDEEFVSEIGHSLLLPDLAVTQKPAEGTAVISEPFITDDDVSAGFLSWTTRQPGSVLLTIILPLVAFGVFATGLLSNTMFGRLKRASEALAYEAKHDALSGLPNRAHMVQKIEEFFASYSARRNGQRALAAYVDIDRFKDINDTLGHEVGDQLIKAVTQRLRKRLRPQDFLSRFGGDEFAIFCIPNGQDSGSALTQRIEQAFASPVVIKGQCIHVTASVGLAVAPEHGTTADELMRNADIALYEAKSRGRDCAVLFCTDMAAAVETRHSIEVALTAAMENQELELHYQPIISGKTRAIVGVEALLRWRHSTHADLSPATFVHIAENAGLIPAIGEWVLDQAMRDAKRWPELQIAVNLSPVQLRHTNLVTSLRELIIKHDLKPDRFVLEVTEGVLLEATDHIKSVLEAIREMGFRIALDDFGTGYSSLSYLCNFHFDKIKIDRSFVSNMSKAVNSKTIVKSVVTLGRQLGMDIVAEGVETESEAAMMTQFGCTELQGFYFSEPIEADKMAGLLKTFRPKKTAATVVHTVTKRHATG